jgi:hypothetical protein
VSWFYNSYSGELTSATGLDALAYQAAIHTGTGWHELHIPASATEAQAAAEAVREVPGGTRPITSLEQGLANEPAAAAKSAAGALGSWSIGGISGTNLVSRALKIIIGGALLLIGLAHMTGAGNAVLETARKAPLPV